MKDLRALALEQAGALLGEGPVIPYALVEGADGTLQAFTIVTQRSDTAFVLARRIVRTHAAKAVAYAITIDTFLRIEGVRTDAILVEVGRRDEMATITAHAYANGAWSGQPVPFDARPSVIGDDNDPRAWTWTAVMPDRYNPTENKVAHIVNHRLSDANEIDRTVRFVHARAANVARNTPLTPPLRQIVAIEDRGQDLDAVKRAAIVNGLEGFAVQWISEMGS
ncbi:MAG: hypothetical protein ABI867_20875 [Kofleriaceae bacterium]